MPQHTPEERRRRMAARRSSTFTDQQAPLLGVLKEAGVNPMKGAAIRSILDEHNPNVTVKEGFGTPTFNALTETMTVFEPTAGKNIVAELPHLQQTEGGKVSDFGLQLRAGLENILNENVYETEGTLEHEAHSEIQPEIEEEVQERAKRFSEQFPFNLSR